MGIWTLVRFLIGDRRAILQLASHPAAVPLGFVFVLSAGFAREYDGEDLWHEPWHVLLPLLASLVSSFLLFCILRLDAGRGRRFFSAYRSFLGLFWKTAPLAWLYAVPYERFLDPVEAMRANLITLGVVAAWRMVLMMRVAVVLFDLEAVQAFFRVMAFGDGLAVLAMFFVPVPLISIMGGVRLSERDKLLQETVVGVLSIGFCSGPIWVIGFFATWMVSRRRRWQGRRMGEDAAPVTWPMRVLAVTSIAVWGAVLPLTQPEQQLRRSVERDFAAGNIAAALATMSAHEPEDFPPHWQPPPQNVSLYGPPPRLLDILEELSKTPVAPWVREIFLTRFAELLAHQRFMNEEQTERVEKLRKSLPPE